MTFWQLGNTSVRSPFRLREGLIALTESNIQGKIRGRDGDYAFRQLLGEHNIVTLGNDVTNSVGRKWRSAMGKLGFLYPEIPKKNTFKQNDIGPLDHITPSGYSLIRAETVPAMQECFLRAMITNTEEYSTPNNGIRYFSPLKMVLQVLLTLEKVTGTSSLTFFEFSFLVQTSNPNISIDTIVKSILEIRMFRNASSNKRKFDKMKYQERAINIGCKPHTFVDYGDMNIRYLKATGLIQSKGKGITLVVEKKHITLQLISSNLYSTSLFEVYKELCSGSHLPTDLMYEAKDALRELELQANELGVMYDVSAMPADSPSDINQIRYLVEEKISYKKEEIYATEQASKWIEIDKYLILIEKRRHYMKWINEEKLVIPESEAPAYFEWAVWRAFLAIDNLVNKPYESRRFKIDQDLLPVSTAPGNGPDLIFELDSCQIIVEVTLTENSRQEAAEGETVRRHIADQVLNYGRKHKKPVYGLFIANIIDLNTTETFRLGNWYSSQGEKIRLDIVPLTVNQFRRLFNFQFITGNPDPNSIKNLIIECSKLRDNDDATIWQADIEHVVSKYTQHNQIRSN